MKASKLFLCGASFALAISMSTPIFAASGSRHMTNSMLKNGMLQNTEKVGGGVWDYGTHIDGLLLDLKTVWSNYKHKTNYHASACQIGNREKNRSGRVAPGQESKSSQTGKKDEQTHAEWSSEA